MVLHSFHIPPRYDFRSNGIRPSVALAFKRDIWLSGRTEESTRTFNVQGEHLPIKWIIQMIALVSPKHQYIGPLNIEQATAPRGRDAKKDTQKENYNKRKASIRYQPIDNSVKDQSAASVLY